MRVAMHFKSETHFKDGTIYQNSTRLEFRPSFHSLAQSLEISHSSILSLFITHLIFSAGQKHTNCH